jgi:hypothetical protein
VNSVYNLILLRMSYHYLTLEIAIRSKISGSPTDIPGLG